MIAMMISPEFEIKTLSLAAVLRLFDDSALRAALGCLCMPVCVVDAPRDTIAARSLVTKAPRRLRQPSHRVVCPLHIAFEPPTTRHQHFFFGTLHS